MLPSIVPKMQAIPRWEAIQPVSPVRAQYHICTTLNTGLKHQPILVQEHFDAREALGFVLSIDRKNYYRMGIAWSSHPIDTSQERHVTDGKFDIGAPNLGGFRLQFTGGKPVLKSRESGRVFTFGEGHPLVPAEDHPEPPTGLLDLVNGSANLFDLPAQYFLAHLTEIEAGSYLLIGAKLYARIDTHNFALFMGPPGEMVKFNPVLPISVDSKLNCNVSMGRTNFPFSLQGGRDAILAAAKPAIRSLRIPRKQTKTFKSAEKVILSKLDQTFGPFRRRRQHEAWQAGRIVNNKRRVFG